MKTTSMRDLYQEVRGLTPKELHAKHLQVTLGGKVKTADHFKGATLLGVEDGTIDLKFQEPVLVIITDRTDGKEKITHVTTGRRVYATGVINKPGISTGPRQILTLSADMVLVED